MSSRQVIQGIFLTVGIAILVLLFMPAVHAPFVVMHGPMTALRAQRAAWLLNLLIQAACLSVCRFAAAAVAILRDV